ncbi:MAG: glycosyltransferase, partial [bacterium]|nr:glycosyltransferase [bacterium]
TGSQTWARALVDTLVMSWRLRRARMTPVVVLTDASLRRHRLQAAVLTAFSGVVVTFMSSQIAGSMFPHRRILGPMPMPVSATRLRWLEELRAQVPVDATPTVSFIGGAYLPRSVFLDRLASALEGSGVEVAIHANKYETSNDDYWRVLATSDIIITTTMQGMPRADMDWIWVQQLVFRFSEALSAGAVLVSSTVVDGDRFFVPGSDFATFISVADAREVLVRLTSDSGERERLRAHGHATAQRLALDHTYWRVIDQALGIKRAMIPA